MNHRLPTTFKRVFALGVCLGFCWPLLAASAAVTTTPSQETPVFVRHAEKPGDAHQTGQLTCQSTYMDQLVAHLVSQNGGDASQVPAWSSDDFDSIFVVTLNHSGSGLAVTFMIDPEALNG